MDADVTASTGRYLSAVLLVSARGDGPARTGEVAETLDVSPASVTERLDALAERDLVAREKYAGATLTDAGEAVTREWMWRHCLAENLVGSDAEGTDADTAGFGNALSEEAATALEAFIDHPCSESCRAPDAEFDACSTDVKQA
ncbi:Mn-dependent DtxR family transcriptional regulator [Halarchaeum rubridurum]|uniref:Iron-dependent repressor n=1 Tax=Halarchaeum rubridurum TaxID=489911 RepID=A0A830G193_9EURY|nr:metal-dependent transcriptional regulator [Halarchaeum rubridurum]MBP1954929.1 Mn-dependent DtxR family transcriptional regulator [Halarchaeum rubridurum]GGM70285.1 iron-dependent repressor [Halarchaeum rubridurum]